MTALTRGRLPARVYWRRRAVLLLAVLALVVGVVRLTGALTGSDGSGSGARPERAAPAAAETTKDATSGAEDSGVTSPDTPSEQRTDPTADATGKRDKQKKAERDRPVLAEPEGVCSDRDVAVTPSIPEPVGGNPVVIELELRTISTPACTWTVSPATLTVKLTSGSDDIWSSADCPGSVPKEDVVVRSEKGTTVEVTWSGRRSDDECSRNTEWAMPGWYYVDASALAGEPSDLHFELVKPDPEVIEKTVKPRGRDAGDSRAERRAEKKRDGREGRNGRERG